MAFDVERMRVRAEELNQAHEAHAAAEAESEKPLY